MFENLPMILRISTKHFLKRNFNKKYSIKILGIETSCDDTGVGIVNEEGKILGEALLTHSELIKKWGGVHPHETSKSHEKELQNVINKSFENCELNNINDVDAIAVTTGPGLSSCLLVGLKEAKKLSLEYNKPLISINHLEAHLLLARMEHQDLKFPFLTLLVSGGHCMLAVAKNIGNYVLLGSTQDDSVGECFDKAARLLNFPIEKGGGKMIETYARNGNLDQYEFTIPLKKENNFNFSFSGLKSQLLRLVRQIEHQEKSIHVDGKMLNSIVKNDKNPTFLDEEITSNLAASFQFAAISHLLNKTEKAIKHSKSEFKDINTLVVSGGVASNVFLREKLKKICENYQFNLKIPTPRLCTDNGIMIAWAGIEKYKHDQSILKNINHNDIDIKPRWPIDTL
eukprot:gene5232-8843_t